MEPKELFDKRYEVYRNLQGKPPIPLEARQMIFDSMKLYASQQTKEVTEERDQVKKELKELWNVLEDPEQCGELLAGM